MLEDGCSIGGFSRPCGVMTVSGVILFAFGFGGTWSACVGGCLLVVGCAFDGHGPGDEILMVD